MRRIRLATWVDVESSWKVWVQADCQLIADGHRMRKLAADLDRYRRVVESTRPDVVVETGTLWGGSAAWLAGLGCSVITVDSAAYPPNVTEGVTYVRGHSVDPGTVRSVAELVSGRRCMVSLDSDHHAPHVVREIQAYAPLVTPGCHLVVEDGIADLLDRPRARHFGKGVAERGGPLVAIERTLATDRRWIRDLEVEQMTAVTHHPAGWWLRG